MQAPARLTPRSRLLLNGALVVAWMLGVGGIGLSCAMLKVYQGPKPAVVASHEPPPSPSSSASTASTTSVSSTTSAAISASPSAATSAAISAAPSSSASGSPAGPPRRSPLTIDAEDIAALYATDVSRRVGVPLAAANLLLSFALVVGVVRARRRGTFGRQWLVQVCFASALFAAVEWVARRDERAYFRGQLEARVEAAHLGADERALAMQNLDALNGGRLLCAAWEVIFFASLGFSLLRPKVAAELDLGDSSQSERPPRSRDDEDER